MTLPLSCVCCDFLQKPYFGRRCGRDAAIDAPAICGRLRGGLGYLSAKPPGGSLPRGGGAFRLPTVPPPVISDEHPAAPRKHEPGPPMDLANMRRQGVHK